MRRTRAEIPPKDGGLGGLKKKLGHENSHNCSVQPTDNPTMPPQACRFIRRLGASCLPIAWLSVSANANALITSEMSLELRGSLVTTSYGQSNVGMFLEINVPLEPRRPTAMHSALLQEEQTTAPEDVPLDFLERDNVDAYTETVPGDAAWGEAAPQGAALPEPLQIGRQFLADLTQAALVAQGCDEAWARLEHLGTRNRVSALLPEVALRAGRETDTALRLTPTDTDPYRYTASGATNLLLEGRLSWRLGRLLFSAEDLGVERLRLARSRERQRVVERTMAVLFRWLRAESELASGRRLTQRQARAARWERTQSELRLDVLTAGWFSAHRPAPAALPAPEVQGPPPAPARPDAGAVAPSSDVRVPSKPPNPAKPKSAAQAAK
jgi:hypothetical protein